MRILADRENLKLRIYVSSLVYFVKSVAESLFQGSLKVAGSQS